MSERTIPTKMKSGIPQDRDFFLTLGSDSRAMQNTTNYYIRNTMTGIKKTPDERTDNEKEVLRDVFDGISKANVQKEKNFDKKCRKLFTFVQTGGSPMHIYGELAKSIKNAKPFPYPTEEKWFLSYNVLDAIFKMTDNPVYRSMPSQLNQNAIRKTVASWQSYFKQKTDCATNPTKYKSVPKIPKYIKRDVATIWFSNQYVVLKDIGKKRYLDFGKGKCLVYVGKASSPVYAGKLTKVEAAFKHGEIALMVTMSDDTKATEEPKNPERVMGIDPGKKNFLAYATNTGSVPFIVKGGAINAINCEFNTQKARLTSELTRGKDSTHSVKNSHALDRLSEKRDNRFRDLFYKIAHAVCRYATKNKIEVILIGHNKGQKDEISMHHEENREFVPIPFTRFISILKTVGEKYGIFVKDREESYTSKASMLDFDDIPTYGEENGTPVFSGHRTKRGMYISKNGTKLNADVNGAANLIRKEYPDAFKDVKDLSYLWKTVDVLDWSCIYMQERKEHKVSGRRNRPSAVSRHRHTERWSKRIEVMQAFDAGKKIHKPAKKDATQTKVA